MLLQRRILGTSRRVFRKTGLEETQPPEDEGTKEPNIAIKPSPVLKAKSESNEENAVPSSEKRTTGANVSAVAPT